MQEGITLAKIRWQDLALTDRDNDPVTDPERIRAALTEFRETESINGYHFERIGADHENEDDASTWGPPSPDDVDWTGFEG